MNFSNHQWKIFSNFTGLRTDTDPQKIDDTSSPDGENVTIGDGDKISVRPLGTVDFSNGLSTIATGKPITSLHTFRKRNGDNVLMCSFGTYVAYYNKLSGSWQTLKSGLSDGAMVGFADYTLSTDQVSYCYFGNGVDNFMRWNGAYGLVKSVSNNTGIISEDGIVGHTGTGTGYTINDILTISGGTGGTVKITDTYSNSIGTYTIQGAGANYKVNDIVSFYCVPSPYPTVQAQFKVTGINGSGGVTSMSIINAGAGYLLSSGFTSYWASGGSGNGDLYISVTSLVNTVKSIIFVTGGSGYSKGTNIATTGGIGTGFTVDINSVLSNSITIDGNDSFVNKGFDSFNNRQLMINGVNYSYSQGEGTTTISGISPDPVAAGIVAGNIITQKIEEHTTNPKGNIYLVADNRLFISGTKDAPQAIYFSKYGDPNDFSSTALITGSTGTASGVFNLGEGGGGVIGMCFDEGVIYAFKNSITYSITLTDTLYVLKPLKPFDGKSQGTGAIFNKSVFAGDNAIFVITVDGKILSLERVDQIDYPQFTAISKLIKNTITGVNFDKSTGITFDDYAYFSYKNDLTATLNNKLLRWNAYKKWWDFPITGWNVADWAVYQDSTTADLYYASSIETKIYKINTIPTDNQSTDITNQYNVKSYYKTKRYDFGEPYQLKDLSNIFIEGYISPTTNLNIDLFLDDNGYTQVASTTFSGTEQDFIVSQTTLNTFGSNPFGVEVLGSNDDTNQKVKFRIYLNKGIKFKSFYNAQLQFSSEGINQQWDILHYGMKVGNNTVEEKKELIRNFK